MRSVSTPIEGYFSVKEAAELLGVSSSTLRNWDRSGKLTAQRHPINGYRMYKREEIEPLMAGLSRHPISSGNSTDSANESVRADVAEPNTMPVLDAVYEMDCIQGMKSLPDNSVDIAIADPPYNASKGGEWKWDNSVKLEGFGGNWSKVMQDWDSMGLSDYMNFTSAWLRELKRVVKPTGSLWIHGTYHNIGIINFLLQALEVEIINEVVWFKRNSFPNLAGRRLTASHESILWAHTGKKRDYFFDYETSKRMDCPEDSFKTAGKQMRTVWDIPNNKAREELKYGKHPTQKPLRLLKRMLELSAKPGWVCLVPFAGAGSECVAAKRAGLRFLAFETDSEYVEICRNRLREEEKQRNKLSLTLFTEAELAPPLEDSKSNSASNESELTSDSPVPSLVKWTGSKRSQAREIQKLIPEHNRYFEPFLGGGAVLFTVAKKGSVAGDIYEPLIEFWRLVQSDPQKVADDYERQWKILQADLPNYFYEVRDRFNATQNPLDLSFLMRTCVNGIVRFNDKGGFNNSFHLSRKGMKPAKFRAIVNTWSDRLVGVKLLCQDYEETLRDAKAGDFVYLDPPYAGNNQRYTENLNIDRIYKVLESLSKKGVKWAWSFDGRRGDSDLSHPVPKSIFKRHLYLHSGNSAVSKVLNGPVESVEESLYLNY
jgi:site-specific DNA-methyltransferase (adenine-specific)